MAFEAEWQSCFANPMTLQQALLGFMVVAALLTIVPGIDTALVLRSSIARSRGYAWATAMGIKTGLLVWGVAAAVGATAILAASEAAYRTMSLAGAVYLMWMGLSFIIRSFPRNGKVPEEHGPQLSGGLWHGWSTGFMTNLLNPKVGVFYLATIPQFLATGISPLLMGILLALVHALVGVVWDAAIIFTGSALGPRLKSQRAIAWIDRVTGGILLAFGARLVAGSR